MATKDFYKSLFPKFSPNTHFWLWFSANISSGTLSNATALLFVYPLDFVHTLQCSSVGKSGSIVKCLTDVTAKRGFSSLYTGFGVSVVGIAVYRMVYFLTFDFLAPIVSKRILNVLVPVFAGLVTYPFDTVRRHLILDAACDARPRYSDAADCFAKLAGELKDDDFARLFQGAVAKILCGVCASAATSYLVEPLVSHLQSTYLRSPLAAAAAYLGMCFTLAAAD